MILATGALSDLTWADLESWAGFKILSRGKSYIKNVSGLRMTSDGGLLAWVRGTKSYATYIEPVKDGEPDWDCTCPYDWGGPCKHAVAVVLKALDHLKENKEFLKVASDDERLALLFFGEDGEECDVLEDEHSEETASALGRDSDVGKIVKAMKREALASLVLELAERFPQVAQDIIERAGRPRRE